jgi:hypothetical protein
MTKLRLDWTKLRLDWTKLRLDWTKLRLDWLNKLRTEKKYGRGFCPK